MIWAIKSISQYLHMSWQIHLLKKKDAHVHRHPISLLHWYISSSIRWLRKGHNRNQKMIIHHTNQKLICTQKSLLFLYFVKFTESIRLWLTSSKILEMNEYRISRDQLHVSVIMIQHTRELSSYYGTYRQTTTKIITLISATHIPWKAVMIYDSFIMTSIVHANVEFFEWSWLLAKF